MQYREFGKTGLKISALGLGAMRLPEYEQDGKWRIREEEAVAVIRRAMELGVNYIDSAYGYCHENSETVVGKAIKGQRDRVILSTKLPLWHVKQQSDFRRLLETQLRRLDVDQIDFYHFHAVSQDKWENVVLANRLLDEAEKALAEGIIKHLSFSFHDRAEYMRTLIDTGLFSSVLCQYNLLDRANEESMAYAREKGMGVVVMGPVGGGRLAAPSKIIEQTVGGRVKSTPEIALRFVLSNPDVCCALSGMSSIEMVEENAGVASDENPLSEQEKVSVDEMLEQTKRLSELYCTGCDYCMPCPKGIRIPHVFQLMNYHRVFGLTDYAKGEFKKLGVAEGAGSPPSACVSCGVCETKCPQKIEIRRQLRETDRALG